MSVYSNYIGIDVGKFNFYVNVYGENKSHEFENSEAGISKFMQAYEALLPETLCVLEPTGGHEMRLVCALHARNFPIHRANARNVKHFIRSFGNKAKTDALDAKALAKYGYSRSGELKLFKPVSEQETELFALTQRRRDLTKYLVAEKNRRQSPMAGLVKESFDKLIDTIELSLTHVDERIDTLMNQDPILIVKQAILRSIPGIGDVTAKLLLVLCPELGTMSGKEIASLGGLAPRSNDSGKSSGHRFTGGGRQDFRPGLFMAAMSASRSKKYLGDFYRRLLERGKKKMVCIVALMRKMLVIANAKIRDYLQGKLTEVPALPKSRKKKAA